jgi:phosphohistidine swiveling domain-containing protein
MAPDGNEEGYFFNQATGEIEYWSRQFTPEEMGGLGRGMIENTQKTFGVTTGFKGVLWSDWDYEASLSQRSGRHTTQLFSGQVYAFQRRRTQTGQIAVVPDAGIFNFFKPLGGFDRMPVDPDPEFDRQFEVYTTNVADARMVLGSAALRVTLMQLRSIGKVFAYFGPSDVLIAVYTDPGWTPVLERAAGLVLETGGILSHGAIVARELGIPALVGVQDATRVVRDGARVALDATAGRLTIA